MKVMNRIWVASLAMISTLSTYQGHAMAPAPSAGGSGTARQINEIYGFAVVPGDDIDSAGFEKAARLLKAHLDKNYSPEFMKRTKLERLTIYRQFNYQGNAVSGLARGSEIFITGRASAVAEANGPSDALLAECANAEPGSTAELNCRAMNASGSGDFLNTFDHELFHVIDITALAAWQDDSSWSRSWIAQNPSDFRYAGGGMVFIQQGKSESFLGSYQPAFISDYAKSSVIEDKAEVFSRYMSDPKRIRSLSRNDSALSAKLKIIQGMLKEVCGGSESSGSCQIPQPFRSR